MEQRVRNKVEILIGRLTSVANEMKSEHEKKKSLIKDLETKEKAQSS